MSKKQPKAEFKPTVLSFVSFANGKKYRIDRVKASGACRVVDLVTNKVRNYTHDEPAAWRSICFDAKLDWHSGRTVN